MQYLYSRYILHFICRSKQIFAVSKQSIEPQYFKILLCKIWPSFRGPTHVHYRWFRQITFSVLLYFCAAAIVDITLFSLETQLYNTWNNRILPVFIFYDPERRKELQNTRMSVCLSAVCICIYLCPSGFVCRPSVLVWYLWRSSQDWWIVID